MSKEQHQEVKKMTYHHHASCIENKQFCYWIAIVLATENV